MRRFCTTSVDRDILAGRAVAWREVARRTESVNARGVNAAVAGNGELVGVDTFLKLDRRTIFTTTELYKIVLHPHVTLPFLRHAYKRGKHVGVLVGDELRRVLDCVVDREVVVGV